MREHMPRVFPNYKDEARNRIIQTALELFNDKGYHPTKMEDIADRLGVSKATIYFYFKSKEDLLIAAIESAPQIVQEALKFSFKDDDFLTNSGIFFDKIKEMVKTWSPGLFFEALSEASRNEAVRKAVRDDSDRTVEIVSKFLGELMNRGLMRRELDITALARGLSSIFYGLMAGRVIGVDEAELRRAWVQSVEAMMRGFLTESQKATRSD
jgi:AcrR family transcriptional regulator